MRENNFGTGHSVAVLLRGLHAWIVAIIVSSYTALLIAAQIYDGSAWRHAFAAMIIVISGAAAFGLVVLAVREFKVDANVPYETRRPHRVETTFNAEVTNAFDEFDQAATRLHNRRPNGVSE